MSLKLDIADVLDPEKVVYYFRDIEQMERFQSHIVRLLIKASQNHNQNIENVRNAFSPQFTDEMKKLIRTHTDGVEFELKGEVEIQDLSEEITTAMDETEQEIEEERWQDEDEDEDDDDYDPDDEDEDE